MEYSLIKSCIISCKGGVPLDRINSDYKELIGEDIPFKARGFASLNTFLLSIEGVTIKNGLVKASSDKTAHIEKMIDKQKPKKRVCINNKENIPIRKRKLTNFKTTSNHFKSTSLKTTTTFKTSTNFKTTSSNFQSTDNHLSYHSNNNYKNFQNKPQSRNNNYRGNPRYNANNFKSEHRDYYKDYYNYYNYCNYYEEKSSNWYHCERNFEENWQNRHRSNGNRYASFRNNNNNRTILNYDYNLMGYWSRQYTNYLYLSQFYGSLNCLLFVNALINH